MGTISLKKESEESALFVQIRIVKIVKIQLEKLGREIRLGFATSSASLKDEFAEVHASSVAKRSLCPDRKAFRVLG